MGFLKRIFKRGPIIYRYDIVEYDSDSDATVYIMGDNIVYILDLDWDDGVMDIEFSVKGSKILDTTNLNVQYKLLNTISHITRKIARECGMDFHTVVFKSSKWRNNKEDEKSRSIRDRFFSRYVLREFPDAKVVDNKETLVIIKLNRTRGSRTRKCSCPSTSL